MRNYDETDKSDVEDAVRLRAKPWMLSLLSANPSYCSWGVGEDAMEVSSGKYASDSFVVDTWAEFGIKNLNDYNEVVHFHFEINRDSEKCECDGSGYAPDARRISEEFYSTYGDRSKRWCDRITIDEAQALVDAERLCTWDASSQCLVKPVVDEAFVASVNAANSIVGWGDLHHDAINRHYLIVARCKRLGYKVTCAVCDGHGYVFTAPEPHIGLTLWVLHPRKGAARGVEIERIEREQLPEVFAYLAEAAKRNADRFARVCALAEGVMAPP